MPQFPVANSLYSKCMFEMILILTIFTSCYSIKLIRAGLLCKPNRHWLQNQHEHNLFTSFNWGTIDLGFIVQGNLSSAQKSPGGHPNETGLLKVWRNLYVIKLDADFDICPISVSRNNYQLVLWLMQYLKNRLSFRSVELLTHQHFFDFGTF